MIVNRLAVIGVLSAGVVAGQASAQVFSGDVQDVTRSQSGRFSVQSVTEAVDRISNARLPEILPGYVCPGGAVLGAGCDFVTGTVDFRRVPMNFDYQLNSSFLRVQIPGLNNFEQTFRGTTRQESAQQFLDFLKTDKDFLRQLGKLLVAKSPADPLAGNPNSLQSSMIGGDFAAALAAASPFEDDEEQDRATLFKPYKVAQAGGGTPGMRGAMAVGNLTGGGITGAALKYQDINANAMMLPLQYNVRSDINPRQGFSIRLPLTYSAYSGSVAGAANLGFSYRYPITNRWIITPSVGYGVTGSTDLGSLGSIVSTSVTSTLGLKFESFDMVVANMVGYFRSLAVPGGGAYSYDPGIANVAFKNGVVLSRRVPLFGAQRSGQVYLFDTRTTGTELFTEDWQELGVTIGSRPRINIARDYGSVSVGYLRSTAYKGATLQASYLF
ncbi:MAG: hypothetical protein ACKVQT_26970 [Burkholderiales bacterium]